MSEGTESTSAADTRELRPRVKAALEYLQHCRYIEQFYCDGPIGDKSRELTGRERAAHDAATDMLTRYFLGEIDLGDQPLCATQERQSATDATAVQSTESVT